MIDSRPPPAPGLSERAAAWGVGVIAIAALALRLVPLLREGGPIGMGVDYDEGVYFSASALLFRGVLPYRDFVFVHPPGLLYALGLTSALSGPVGVTQAFAASRVVASLIGAVNVVLVGKLAQRWAGPAAGLLAATLYATYPEVVVVERGPYLEPVLNLACLAAAWIWVSPRTAGAPRRVLAAGALLAAACAVKVWGGIWLLAGVLSPAGPRGWSASGRLVAAAAVVGLVLVGPLAAAAPGPFFTDVLLFHAWRPPDGDVDRLHRVLQIWSGRHLVCSVLALSGLLLALVRKELRAARELRFFASAYALTVIAFLLSSAYWSQYNSHLAASEAVLAGWGGITLFRTVLLPRLAGLTRLSPSGRVGLALAAIALLAFPSLRRVILSSRARAPELLALGEGLRRAAPPDACVFAFEPAWGIAGGFLPPHGVAGMPVIVDPYAAMLLEASTARVSYRDAGAAFQGEASQQSIRALLERCRFTVLGWRGHWQLSEATRAWLGARSTVLGPQVSRPGYDVWERR